MKDRVGTQVMLDKGDDYYYFIFNSKRIERIGLDMVVKYNKFSGDTEVISDYDELKEYYNRYYGDVFKAVQESVLDTYKPVIN